MCLSSGYGGERLETPLAMITVWGKPEHLPLDSDRSADFAATTVLQVVSDENEPFSGFVWIFHLVWSSVEFRLDLVSLLDSFCWFYGSPGVAAASPTRMSSSWIALACTFLLTDRGMLTASERPAMDCD